MTARQIQDLPREFVEGHQRQRILLAVAEFAHEFGIAEAKISAICELAHMSRQTYFSLFGSASGCLRYVFTESFERIFAPVKAAGEGSEPWLWRLNAAVEAFLSGVAAEPLLAELCLIHSAAALEAAAGANYQAGVDVMVEVLQGGREAGRAALGDAYRDPAPPVEEFLACGIVSMAATRIKQEETAILPEHRDELVLLSANTFLGPEEAARLWREL